jgi:hypothetical protein
MSSGQPDASPVQDPFPPIADYAFLSDCEVTARPTWSCRPPAATCLAR